MSTYDRALLERAQRAAEAHVATAEAPQPAAQPPHARSSPSRREAWREALRRGGSDAILERQLREVA